MRCTSLEEAGNRLFTFTRLRLSDGTALVTSPNGK
jgi:hypothetical protein